MYEVLSRTTLFQALPPEVLARLAEQGKKRHFPAGSLLMRQGDLSNSLHIILDGRLRVERLHPQLTKPMVLAELGPGEVVGEMGVLDRQPRTATVMAIRDTETLELSIIALALTIVDFPEVATALLRMLSRRLRSTDELFQHVLGQEQNEAELRPAVAAKPRERSRSNDEWLPKRKRETSTKPGAFGHVYVRDRWERRRLWRLEIPLPCYACGTLVAPGKLVTRGQNNQLLCQRCRPYHESPLDSSASPGSNPAEFDLSRLISDCARCQEELTDWRRDGRQQMTRRVCSHCGGTGLEPD